MAKNVQVRKESWGLLFYSQPRHKVRFVKSGDWLFPEYFDGTWTFNELVGDIASRTGTPDDVIESSLQKVTKYLIDSEIIINELC
ncbi:hypothetical protein ACFLXU_06480 [Chloroflexota bacterium]